MLLVREKKVDEAIVWLKRAAERAPEIARYAYVYGVALSSTGRTAQALDALAGAAKRHPKDREILPRDHESRCGPTAGGAELRRKARRSRARRSRVAELLNVRELEKK